MGCGCVLACELYRQLLAGHLKRFMRGIAELVEVSKSAPATPSSIPSAIPPSAQFNGVGVAGGRADNDIIEDTSKTPEPPMESKLPPELPPELPTESKLPPPANEGVAPKPHPPVEHVNSPSNFARMRSILAQQMGLTNDSDVGDLGQDSSDGPSPSPSPLIQHRDAKSAAGAPPPPKRGAGQAAAANRHSYSSSTSSLSSNQSERVPASQDLRRSVEVPIAAQQQLPNQGEAASPILPKPDRRKSSDNIHMYIYIPCFC